MEISNQSIKLINIIKLKQLENVNCSFEGHNLTALLGINGCGKSTILHALACCYQPLTTGQDHKFSDFFFLITLIFGMGRNFKYNILLKIIEALKDQRM